MAVVLACDLGGSSFRASLVDDAGDVKALAVVASPEAAGRDGISEIAPEAWWINLLEAAGELARREPGLFGKIAAVAICGMTRSQVLLDTAGKAVRPAMIWNDSRAVRIAANLSDQLAGRHTEVEHLNAFHPLARLAWVKANEPDIFNRIAHVLDPKDYLNFRLTGQAASDRISLARLLAASGQMGEQMGGQNLFDACGLSARILPRILAPRDVAGCLQTGLPAPFERLGGVPVFCCSNDTWAAVAGLGAMQPGFAYNISGTTEVLGVMSVEPAAADGLLTVDWGGLSQLGGPSLNGADTMTWLMSLL
ncbi:MAG: xylulokinase, partial [Bosea sp. (in: a-proteobacteria)]